MERDYKLLLIVGVLVFVALFITLVLADALSTPTVEFNFNQLVSNNYSITLNKTEIGGGVNFTWINITLPNNFTFTNNTNATNSTYSHTFSNMTNASGNIVLVWNSSGVMNHNDTAVHFSFNATSPNPGNFTIWILTLDNATTPTTNTTNVSVYINDTIYPEITIVNPSNNSNFSSTTFDLNYTFVDATSGFCWYSNNSGVANSSTLSMGTNLSGLTSVSWTEGQNNVTVWCNDTDNNVNSTFVRFTIDLTDPTIYHSCSPTLIAFGGKVTCSCSADDAISGISSSSGEDLPNTQTFGAQTTSCSATDHAGNSASSTLTYHVISGGGGGGASSGEGGYQGYDNTFVEDTKEFSEVMEITKSLGGKNRIRIKINDQSHYVGVKELTTTTATIEVSSTPQEAVLNIGDEKKFDITEDGYYDLKVKLNSIVSAKADITIKSLHEQISEVEAVSLEEKVEEELKTLKEQSWKIWVIIGIILVVIIVGYFIFKKK